MQSLSLITFTLVATLAGTWAKPVEVNVYDPDFASKYSVEADNNTTVDPVDDQKSTWETREGNLTKWHYSLIQPDGKLRNVTYTLTPNGGVQATHGDTGWSKPVEVSVYSKPAEVSYVHKPVEVTYLHKPVEVTYLHKPVEVTYLHKPVEVSYVQKPVEVTYVPKPVEVSLVPTVVWRHRPVVATTSNLGTVAYPRYNSHYSVDDKTTGDQKSVSEHREGDVTKGHYSLLQPDGVVRNVTYTVTPTGGFQAEVTNTGTASHPVRINHHHKHHHIAAVVPAVVQAAPVVAAVPVVISTAHALDLGSLGGWSVHNAGTTGGAGTQWRTGHNVGTGNKWTGHNDGTRNQWAGHNDGTRNQWAGHNDGTRTQWTAHNSGTDGEDTKWTGHNRGTGSADNQWTGRNVGTRTQWTGHNSGTGGEDTKWTDHNRGTGGADAQWTGRDVGTQWTGHKDGTGTHGTGYNRGTRTQWTGHNRGTGSKWTGVTAGINLQWPRDNHGTRDAVAQWNSRSVGTQWTEPKTETGNQWTRPNSITSTADKLGAWTGHSGGDSGRLGGWTERNSEHLDALSIISNHLGHDEHGHSNHPLDLGRGRSHHHKIDIGHGTGLGWPSE